MRRIRHSTKLVVYGEKGTLVLEEHGEGEGNAGQEIIGSTVRTVSVGRIRLRAIKCMGYAR